MGYNIGAESQYIFGICSGGSPHKPLLAILTAEYSIETKELE